MSLATAIQSQKYGEYLAMRTVSDSGWCRLKLMQVSAEISAVLRSESLGTLKDLADGFMEAFCGVVFAVEMVVNNKSVVSEQHSAFSASVLNMSLGKLGSLSLMSGACNKVLLQM